MLLGVAWKWGRLLRLAVPAFFGGRDHQCLHAPGHRPAQRVWESRPLPPREPDGARCYDSRWWFITVPLAVGFACRVRWCCSPTCCRPSRLWPPAGWHADAQRVHLHHRRHRGAVGGVPVRPPPVLPLRRAVGMFQSLAWMGNQEAMVVGFERDRRPIAPAVAAPATMSARCASSRATSSARCSPAPNAPSA